MNAHKGRGRGHWGTHRGRSSGGGPSSRRGLGGGFYVAPEPRRRGMYRARSAVFLGVCQGLANYFDISVFWLRLLVTLCILFTGLWPGVFLYFMAALLMRLEPVVPVQSPSEKEFYDSYSRSRGQAISRLKEKFDRLDKRIRRAEDIVTSSDYQWEQKFHQKKD